jgi:putative tryptophan/tyrosine transport system substrate-binding protein
VRRIGVLANEPWPAIEGLHVGLDELGYDEGKDFLIEYRFAEGDARRFPELAVELVRFPVDVIVAWGTPATLAALKATSSIPIVMSAGDPVGAGQECELFAGRSDPFSKRLCGLPCARCKH